MQIRFIVPVFAVMLACAGMAQAAGEIGVVGALTGKATATAAGKTRSLSVGDPIHREDMLSTGAGSKMQVMLDDQSTITLNPNSKLQVSEFAFDASAHDGSIKMDALKGAFRFIGGAVSKKREAKIKTPVSSIGIRGSIGDTFVAANGATEAVFASGDQMSMTNANGDTTITTDFGTGFSMQTPNDAPQPMSVNQVISRTTDFTAFVATGGDSSGGNDGGDGGDGTTGNDGGNAGSSGDGGDDSAAGNDGGEDNADSADSLGGFGDDGSDAGGTDTAGNDGGDANNGADNADSGANQTNDAANENQRVDTVNSLSGNARNAFNDPESVRNTIQTAINNGADAAGNIGADNIDNSTQFRGLLAKQNYDPTTSFEDVDTTRISELNDVVRNLTQSRFQGDEQVVNGSGDNGPFNVPSPTNGAGPFFNLTPATPDFIEIDGDAYKGFAFRSPSGLTTYYRFNQIGANVSGNSFTPVAGPDIGDEIKLFIGQEVSNSDVATVRAATIAQSNTRGTDDITYYGFLPSLNNHSRASADVPTPGHDGVGIFNYGIIDVQTGVSNETDFANLGTANGGEFGVAINWNKGQFFSGFVRWGEGQTTPSDDYDTVAFGQVDTTGGAGNLFDGNAYTTGESPDAAEEHVLDNNFSTGFKDNNDVVESIVIGGQDAGDSSIDGTILQPGFILDTSGSNGTELKANTNTQTAGSTTYRGFTAGFHERDTNSVNGGVQRTSLYSSDAGDFNITTDSTDNSTAATIQVTDGTEIYDFDFGANSNATDGDSVFLSDDMYAAELGRAKYDNGGTIYDVDSNEHNTGYIANATTINDVNECSLCNYVHWGVWSASTDLDAAGVSGAVPGEINTSQLMPYVAGEMMTGSEFQTFRAGNSGLTATYNGELIGTVENSGAFSQATGNFSIQIDMLNRELETLTGTLSNAFGTDFSFTSSGVALIDNAGAFAQTETPLSITFTGPEVGTGSLNGAVFGPNADNVGGNFIANSTSYNVNGVFLGVR